MSLLIVSWNLARGGMGNFCGAQQSGSILKLIDRWRNSHEYRQNCCFCRWLSRSHASQ